MLHIHPPAPGPRPTSPPPRTSQRRALLHKAATLQHQECQATRADIIAQRQQCAQSWAVLAAATERLACSRQFLVASAP